MPILPYEQAQQRAKLICNSNGIMLHKYLFIESNVRKSKLLRNLHWLPILKRFQFKTVVFTFKILYSEVPLFLRKLLNWCHPTKHLRSTNRTLLVPSRSRTVKLGRRLMDTAAATLWNTLPHGIKCSPSVVI